MTSSLTTIESNALATHEETIAHGLETFVDVGNALAAIRDGRLYRKGSNTFEDYCQKRWGMGRNYVNKQIKAAAIVANLGTMVPNTPLTERQARPLSSLPPDQQRKAWQTAVATAPDGKITAAHVAHTVRKMSPDGQRGIVRHDGNLKNTIATCQVCNQLYDGEALSYCPYCAYTQEQRMAYVEDESRKDRKSVAHISNNSGENEWYTPAKYTEAARAVMGGIDLDPASSDIANETVKATMYYTEESDGLAWDWNGRIWMNPPYAQPLITYFCDKLTTDLDNGFITEAITLTNNATETKWFRAMSARCAAVCFIAGRIKFIDKNGNPGGAPLQGQAILYFGEQVYKFTKAFSEFGQVFYATR